MIWEMEEQPNNPLHGKRLDDLLKELVENYGWERMGQSVPIRCFTHNPSLGSSLKFLRRTAWARNKVEAMYREMIMNSRDSGKSSAPPPWWYLSMSFDFRSLLSTSATGKTECFQVKDPAFNGPVWLCNFWRGPFVWIDGEWLINNMTSCNLFRSFLSSSVKWWLPSRKKQFCTC